MQENSRLLGNNVTECTFCPSINALKEKNITGSFEGGIHILCDWKRSNFESKKRARRRISSQCRETCFVFLNVKLSLALTSTCCSFFFLKIHDKDFSSTFSFSYFLSFPFPWITVSLSLFNNLSCPSFLMSHFSDAFLFSSSSCYSSCSSLPKMLHRLKLLHQNFRRMGLLGWYSCQLNSVHSLSDFHAWIPSRKNGLQGLPGGWNLVSSSSHQQNLVQLHDLYWPRWPVFSTKDQ